MIFFLLLFLTLHVSFVYSLLLCYSISPTLLSAPIAALWAADWSPDHYQSPSFAGIVVNHQHKHRLISFRENTSTSCVSHITAYATENRAPRVWKVPDHLQDCFYFHQDHIHELVLFSPSIAQSTMLENNSPINTTVWACYTPCNEPK